jgi:hypothetical protein
MARVKTLAWRGGGGGGGEMAKMKAWHHGQRKRHQRSAGIWQQKLMAAAVAYQRRISAGESSNVAKTSMASGSWRNGAK